MTSQVITAFVVAAVVLGALARRWWLHGAGSDPGSSRLRLGHAAPSEPEWLSVVLDGLEAERQVWLRAALAQQEARQAMWRALRRSRP